MHINEEYRAESIPQPGEIIVRRIPFEFPDDIDPHWKRDEPEWSHMINGASLTMPYLEPFLIDSMREALTHIDDPNVREEARGFIAQEGQHYRQHRRYNDHIKSSYPELAAIEEDMQRSFDWMRARRSLRFRMGFTAGFETMTMGVTRWLVAERRDLFAEADTRVSSFVLWHMVEETEHKRVAFNVYQAACPGYGMRALGVLTGSLHVMWYSRRAYIAMLSHDGLWRDLRSRRRLWRRAAQFLRHTLPCLVRGMLPGHTPDKEPDPIWVRDWIANYARRDDAARLPLIDTASADLPAP